MITIPTLGVTVILCGLLLTARRTSHVLSIFIIGMCFLPSAQAIVIAGLDFKVIRILALVGLARIFIKNEKRNINFNIVDKLLIAWCLSETVFFIIQVRSSSGFIYQMGRVLDLFIVYYIFRTYLKSFEDIKTVLITAFSCSVILAPLVALEVSSSFNPFSIFGKGSVLIRDGEPRGAGAFNHPIHLGSYAAAFIPLALTFIQIQANRNKKLYLYLATFALFFLLVASNSSGPLLAGAAAIGCWAVFSKRRLVGKVSWGVLATIISLHLVMNKPVWHLIARLDVIGGSTGYHRFVLIDKTVSHFKEWALCGTRSVAHWGVWKGDITNMYIYEGVQGGFVTFVLFSSLVFMMCRTFWKASLIKIHKKHSKFIWALFCGSIAHAVSFISISYFGQIFILLIIWVAIAAAIIPIVRQEKMLFDKGRKEYEEAQDNVT